MTRTSGGAILLLRHAETAWNASGRLNSRTDLPLSAEGAVQAKAMADALRSIAPFRVVSSPALRALQTAEPLLEGATGNDVDERWRELDFGEFEGLTPADARTGIMATTFAAWRETLDGSAGTEPASSGIARAGEAFGELLATAGTTVVVSHGVIARIVLMERVLGAAASGYRRLRLDNASLAIVTFGVEGPRLVGLNLRGADEIRTALKGSTDA